MQKKTLSLLLLALLSTGCKSYDTRDFIGLRTEPASTRLGSAVFYANKCPLDTFKAAEEEPISIMLLGAAMSISADFAVKAIGNTLEKNKEGLNGQFIATGVHNKKTLDDGSCLIIARGLFGKFNNKFKIPNDHLTKDLLSGFGLADYPAFYMELNVKDRDNALELDPIYLSYAASSARTYGSGRKHVSVVIAMSDTAPKASEGLQEEKAFAIFRHDFGRLNIGNSYQNETLKGTNASQPKSEKFNQEAFNISALVTESEEPGIARLALIDAFSNKKGDLQLMLEQAIKNVLNGKEEKK